MINLKFKLDPKDKTQMLALSAFASTLAFAKEGEEPVAVPEIKLAPYGRTVENQAHEDAMGNTEPLEEPKAKEEKPEPPKRRRRTKAEIEAEKAEQENEEQDEEEEDSDDAESEDAEEQGGEASTAERNGKQITLDDIRAAVAEKKDKHFKKMKAELKDRYGVETTPKLPVEHYAAFFDFVNGLM